MRTSPARQQQRCELDFARLDFRSRLVPGEVLGPFRCGVRPILEGHGHGRESHRQRWRRIAQVRLLREQRANVRVHLLVLRSRHRGVGAVVADEHALAQDATDNLVDDVVVEGTRIDRRAARRAGRLPIGLPGGCPRGCARRPSPAAARTRRGRRRSPASESAEARRSARCPGCRPCIGRRRCSRVPLTRSGVLGTVVETVAHGTRRPAQRVLHGDCAADAAEWGRAERWMRSKGQCGEQS